MDDKLQHKIVGHIIALIVGGLLYYLTENVNLSWPIGFAAGCLAGVAKEYYDLKVKKTLFNWEDLYATIWGSAVGTIMLLMMLWGLFID